MITSLKSPVSSLLLALSAVPFASAIPVEYDINYGQTECLYSAMRANEIVTTSVFVSGGEELKVRTSLQGPIAPYEISTSAEVLAAAMRIDKLGKDKNTLNMNRVEMLDFENLYMDDVYMDDYDDDWGADDDDEIAMEMDDDVDDIIFRDYYYMDDDDHYRFIEDDAMDDIEIEELRKLKAKHEAMDPAIRAAEQAKAKAEKEANMKKLKERREAAKQAKISEYKDKKRKERDEKRHQKMMHAHLAEGDPVEKTFQIEEDGWYRFCAEAYKVRVSVMYSVNMSSLLQLQHV